MDHVPTLCALSTVGIAAAGLALGRSEQPANPRPSSNKRKAGDTFRSFSSPLTGSSTTPARHVLTPTFTSTGGIVSRKEAQQLSKQPSIDNRPSTAEWQLRAQHNLQSTPLNENANPRTAQSQDQPLASRKSSSWLRRLSTSSSFNESISRPTTPSISFSNRSSTPILSSKLSTPNSQEPNRLVKRTTSHAALRQTPSHSSTFRRPATSHQRSADFLHQMALEEEMEVSGTENEARQELSQSSPESTTWRPFFDNDRSQKSGNIPRKRHTSGINRTTPVKTINNEVDELPTLLMATSIAHRASEDDIDDTEDRPVTRMGVDQVEFGNKVVISSDSPDPDQESKPRPSFSLGDIFSNRRLSRGDSLRKKKVALDPSETVRHVSSPIMPPPSRGSKKDRSNNRLTRRRNITDPTLFKAPRAPPQLDLSAAGPSGSSVVNSSSMSSPLPPVNRMSAFDIDLPGGTPTFPSSPYTESRRSPNNLSHAISPPTTAPAVSSNMAVNSRGKRFSQAGSDPASTLIGSDGDTRVFTSGDEDSMDFQSDTAYDSLATRATASSHSGLRGPWIETIFDESPPHGSLQEKLVPLEELINGGSFSERFSSKSPRRSLLGDSDDDDQFSTPMKAPSNEHDQSRRTTAMSHNAFDDFASSPPSVIRFNHDDHIRVRPASGDVDMIDEDEDWDLDNEGAALDGEHLTPGLPHHTRRVSPLPFRLAGSLSPAPCSDSQDAIASKRSSIFEWSEQQKSDREALNGSSPRPKTVHGKQGNEARGSRTSGRRGPSTLHLRSQSVPVTRDPDTETNAANGNAGKFGTWGLGNKGVSEEWNDDFEFDDADDEGEADDEVEQRSILGGKGGMKVPQAIIDRQASVHVQFGQVQEFTLLVEELKRLRTQASPLGLLEGPSSSLWKDAEAVVNLATLDEEDEDFAFPRTPASPSFDFDAFEEETPPAQRQQNMSPFGEGHPRRNSVLRRSMSGPATPPTGRPRGESVAQARSFLQTIYQNRSELDASNEVMERKVAEKLPFDTQDLRNLVTRAGVLTRALKEIVRKAEGVPQSPTESPAPPRDPPFSRIFRPHDLSDMEEDPKTLRISSSPEKRDSPNRQQGLPKSQSAHGYLRGSMSPSSDKDIAGHMKLMTVA